MTALISMFTEKLLIGMPTYYANSVLKFSSFFTLLDCFKQLSYIQKKDIILCMPTKYVIKINTNRKIKRCLRRIKIK